jgi:hypothetical protein
MPDPKAGLPPRFLRTPEAAGYLGLSGRTLEKHRTYGTGPTYRRPNGRREAALPWTGASTTARLRLFEGSLRLSCRCSSRWP